MQFVYDADDQFLADAIYHHTDPPKGDWVIHPYHHQAPVTLTGDLRSEDLLVPVFRQGQRVYAPPPLKETRQHCLNQIAKLRPEFARLQDAKPFPVGLEQNLYELKLELMSQARQKMGQ